MAEGASMQNDTMLSDKQVEGYLCRLGFEGEVHLNKEFLDDLTFLHQCAIPFETIDMHHCSEPPSLAPEDVYKKLVTQKRGGYCFELNLLFEMLLASLGFSTRSIMCRAVRGRPGRMPINHRGVIVELLGESHFVDVGFGGPLAAGSLLLKDGLTQDVRGERYTPRFLSEHWWAVERKTRAEADLYGDDAGGRVQVEIELGLAPFENIDFDALNVFFSRRGYLFSETNIANIRTAKGFIGLRDTTLTIRENNTIDKRELQSDEEFAQALEEYFGLRPWP